MPRMARREFPNMQAVHEYARRNRKLYAWEGTPKFAEYRRRLSPDQYEIADVRHSQGIRRVMLFPQTALTRTE
jgi:hypothetical protein